MQIVNCPDDLAIDETTVESSLISLPVLRQDDWAGTPATAGRIVKFPDDFPDIPQDSPIYPIKHLKKNWDNEGADAFSLLLLHRAEKFWRALTEKLDKAGLPQVTPGHEDFVAFVWTQKLPKKRLDIWIFGESLYRANWELESKDDASEGEAVNLRQLLELVDKYFRA